MAEEVLGPEELTVFICVMCGKPHLSRASLMKCHNSGRWVVENKHYIVQRYQLVEDQLVE